MGAPWPSGPWTVEDHPRDRSPVNIIADGTFIAVSRDVDAARLIAAAPDMAEALEPFVAFFEIYRTINGRAENSTGLVHAVASRAGERSLTVEHFEAARAALSKAKGETA